VTQGRTLLRFALVVLAACSPARRQAPAAGDAGVTTVPNALHGCADLAACEVGCRGGSVSHCLAAANNYSTAEGTPKDEARAAALLEAACALQSGAGCNLVGRAYEFGHGVAVDLAKAFSSYDHACRLEYQGGCYNLAVLLERGRGTARDANKALSLYRNVCAAGSQTACAAAERVESAK
jgi:TPR repeat protein